MVNQTKHTPTLLLFRCSDLSIREAAYFVWLQVIGQKRPRLLIGNRLVKQTEVYMVVPGISEEMPKCRFAVPGQKWVHLSSYLFPVLDLQCILRPSYFEVRGAGRRGESRSCRVMSCHCTVDDFVICRTEEEVRSTTTTTMPCTIRIMLFSDRGLMWVAATCEKGKKIWGR